MNRLQRLLPPGPLGEIIAVLLISIILAVLTFGDGQSATPEPTPAARNLVELHSGSASA